MVSTKPQVGLFVTCLVDVIRPEVGFATVQLLEAAGCRVEVPAHQTCCGQPASSAGDRQQAAAVAREVIRSFESFDYVVGPSGSCLSILARHYPLLLSDDPEWWERARSLARRTWELTRFLDEVAPPKGLNPAYPGIATYHDSCSGLRELGIREQPRRLLGQVQGLELRDMEARDVCCGFGGTFCVSYPEISARMVDDKVASILATGADTVLGGDLGCLMNIAGRLRRRGEPLRVFHVAEVLAGRAQGVGLAGALEEAAV